MVEHIVLFKLKDGTTDSEKSLVVETLKTLASIEGIKELSVGLNHSQEGKSKGFEVCMRVCFENQAALDAYIPSPAHVSTVDKVRQYFEDVIVVDYTP